MEETIVVSTHDFYNSVDTLGNLNAAQQSCRSTVATIFVVVWQIKKMVKFLQFNSGYSAGSSSCMALPGSTNKKPHSLSEQQIYRICIYTASQAAQLYFKCKLSARQQILAIFILQF